MEWGWKEGELQPGIYKDLFLKQFTRLLYGMEGEPSDDIEPPADRD